MSIIDEIAAERRRQIEVEGWDIEHDDSHDDGELAVAAACYALGERNQIIGPARRVAPVLWPWSSRWWKPKDRRRDCIRAAALLVAEIERLDRLAAPEQAEEARDGE